jgi:hypothetical protein
VEDLIQIIELVQKLHPQAEFFSWEKAWGLP